MSINIRDLDRDGLPDEVVGSGRFHLERLDEDCYWISLDGLSFTFRIREEGLVLLDFPNWRSAKAVYTDDRKPKRGA